MSYRDGDYTREDYEELGLWFFIFGWGAFAGWLIGTFPVMLIGFGVMIIAWYRSRRVE